MTGIPVQFSETHPWVNMVPTFYPKQLIYECARGCLSFQTKGDRNIGEHGLEFVECLICLRSPQKMCFLKVRVVQLFDCLI